MSEAQYNIIYVAIIAFTSIIIAILSGWKPIILIKTKTGISEIKSSSLKRRGSQTFLIILCSIILLAFSVLFIIDKFWPQVIPRSDVKIISVEENKYVDPKLRYTIKFPNSNWIIDTKWSKVDWINWGDRNLHITVISYENTDYRSVDDSIGYFDYEHIDGVSVTRLNSDKTEYIDISNKKARMIEFGIDYDLDKGYTSSNGYGKAYFFLEENNNIFNKYIIVFAAASNNQSDAQKAYYSNSYDFDYILNNFKLID